MRWDRLALFAAPGLALAVAGLFHPASLTASSADTWTLLHVVLLPVFPLLGLLVWWLLRGVPGPLAWAAKVAAFGFAAFYTALDVLAGIATGALARDAVERGVPLPSDEIGALFSAGSTLGRLGAWLFIAACALASVALFVRAGNVMLPGAVLLTGGAYLLSEGHVYWPVGGSGMLALAAGFALLAMAPHARAVTQEQPAAPPASG